jgi:MIP family channel proteins
MEGRTLDTKKLLAELIGTFTFFLIGFMAILSQQALPAPDLVVIALGFGFGLFAAIQIFGGVSGGHFNPAVTLAAVIDKRLDAMTGVGYVVSQLIGGIAAAVVVMLLFDQASVAGTRTLPGNGIDDVKAVIIEAVFTAFFLLVILVSTKKAPTQAAFAIPLTLMVIHFAIVPFTGSSVNPARSIASAVVGGDLTSLWVYIVGPLVGAVIGWAIFKYATGETEAG